MTRREHFDDQAELGRAEREAAAPSRCRAGRAVEPCDGSLAFSRTAGVYRCLAEVYRFMLI